MKILKVGDKEKALCHTCKKMVDISYQLHDVPFSDGSGLAKNILVGMCERCHSVVSVPHQSTPAIKLQLGKQREALESRVPAHMVDILNVVSFELGSGIEFVPCIIKYYLHALSQNEISCRGIGKFLLSDLAQGKSQKRLSLKGRYVQQDVALLKTMTKIDSTSDLLKSVVLKINDDILVQKNPKTIKNLTYLIAAYA